jgi:hypothetical protein
MALRSSRPWGQWQAGTRSRIGGSSAFNVACSGTELDSPGRGIPRLTGGETDLVAVSSGPMALIAHSEECRTKAPSSSSIDLQSSFSGLLSYEMGLEHRGRVTMARMTSSDGGGRCGRGDRQRELGLRHHQSFRVTSAFLSYPRPLKRLPVDFISVYAFFTRVTTACTLLIVYL